MSYKHNFGNCTITWAGIDIKASVDAGMSVTDAQTVPRNAFKTTGTGKTVRMVNPDHSGVLTCTIDYSSPAHALLMVQFGLETIGVLTIYDGDMKRNWYYKNATLVTDPNLAMGVETGPFSWQWYYEDRDFVQALSNLNLNVQGA